MNILSELWQMRYIASEACGLVILLASLVMSVVAIYVALESKKRVDRKVKVYPLHSFYDSLNYRKKQHQSTWGI